jgi:hypothetical protein
MTADLSEAEHDAAFWERLHRTSMKQVEICQELIANAERRMAEERERARLEAERWAEARAKVARVANYKGA